MCNGFSTRTSEGGAIAVLRSQLPSSQLGNAEEMRLFFQRGSESGTQAAFRLSHMNEVHALKGCWVVVHQNGDLTATSTPTSSTPGSRSNSMSSDTGDAPAPLHFFRFEPQVLLEAHDNYRAMMDIPDELNLTAGGSGVIGRRVSIQDSLGGGSRTLAEGVIGWN